MTISFFLSFLNIVEAFALLRFPLKSAAVKVHEWTWWWSFDHILDISEILLIIQWYCTQIYRNKSIILFYLVEAAALSSNQGHYTDNNDSNLSDLKSTKGV